MNSGLSAWLVMKMLGLKWKNTTYKMYYYWRNYMTDSNRGYQTIRIADSMGNIIIAAQLAGVTASDDGDTLTLTAANIKGIFVNIAVHGAEEQPSSAPSPEQSTKESNEVFMETSSIVD